MSEKNPSVVKVCGVLDPVAVPPSPKCQTKEVILVLVDKYCTVRGIWHPNVGLVVKVGITSSIISVSREVSEQSVLYPEINKTIFGPAVE